MTFNISTGLAQAMLARPAKATKPMHATTISFGDGDGTGGRDTINDSGSGLGNFSVSDWITVHGSTSNDGCYEMLSVAANKIEVPAGSLTTEAVGDTVFLVSARGGSFMDIMKFCVIDIFAGTQPATADLAESGAVLVRITQNSLAFTSGVDTNGLLLGTLVDNVISPRAGQVWSGPGLANGTAVWFRAYENTVVTGDSTSAVRFDGACGNTGTKELNMSNLNVKVGGTSTVDTATWTLPK